MEPGTKFEELPEGRRCPRCRKGIDQFRPVGTGIKEINRRLLKQNGYRVGKYISIEKQIEKTRDRYYDVLEMADDGVAPSFAPDFSPTRAGAPGVL